LKFYLNSSCVFSDNTIRVIPYLLTLPDISIDDAVMVLLNAGYTVYTPGLQRIPGKGVE